MVKACLAVVIIGFSLYSLFGRSIVLESESWAGLFLCGLFAGIFGGAYGLNGPPLVVYGSMRRWSVQHFRATLQGYFLPASMVRSEEHTSELQSLMRTSYAVFCFKKKK